MRLVIATLVAFVSVGFVRAADEKVEDGATKFEIVFPDKAKANPGKGQKQWILERDGGKAALLMQVNSFPSAIDTGNADLAKTIMDGGQGALVNAFKGAKLLSSKEIKFGKYPGRDVDVDAPGLGIYRVKFVLTPNNFYQITALGPKDFVDGAEVKKFMESFKMKD